MFDKKYVKTTAKDGTVVYGTKHQFNKVARDIQKNHDATVDGTIDKLKNELKDLVEYRNKLNKQATNPKSAPSKGDQHKGLLEDLNDTTSDIHKVVGKLHNVGVKVNRVALSKGKVVYEKEMDNMFTTSEIKEMRLEVFEENAAKRISDDLRDYLLTALETVSKEMEAVEAYNEAVEKIVSSKRDRFVKFITESYQEGLIDSLQKEVMLEMAEDDFMFAPPTTDRIPELVSSYLEAAEAGDDVKKAEIKKDIDDAKALKDIEDKVNDDVVTEGAECSIVEKLESLKIKLTPEEKAMAENFDKMIEEKMNGKEKSEGEEPEEKPEEPAKEEPTEEKTLTESVAGMFGSISVASGVTDEMAESMKEYMTEAVADHVYSEEDLARVNRLLAMR